MRALSKVEQDIIRQLIPKGKILTQLLGGISKELVIKIDKESKKLEVIIKNHEDGRVVDKQGLDDFYIKRLFFINTLMKLIVLLENTGFVVTYNIAAISDKIRYIGDEKLVDEIKNGKCKKIISNIEDEFLISKFIRYSESYIVATEELKEFVAKGFKTPEQLRFNKTYIISIIAISISFLIGVLSLWTTNKNTKKPIKINDTQMKEIIHQVDLLNNSININSSTKEQQINEIIIKIDSLNSNIKDLKNIKKTK